MLLKQNTFARAEEKGARWDESGQAGTRHRESMRPSSTTSTNDFHAKIPGSSGSTSLWVFLNAPVGISAPVNLEQPLVTSPDIPNLRAESERQWSAQPKLFMVANILYYHKNCQTCKHTKYNNNIVGVPCQSCKHNIVGVPCQKLPKL